MHKSDWTAINCANKSNLQLFECVFKLDANIQFERIKDNEY